MDISTVPHCGYHGPALSSRPHSITTAATDLISDLSPVPDTFFEGWYVRLCLPAEETSFAFMYSIEDPHLSSDRSGGTMQILGPGDRLAARSIPNTNYFWASPNTLSFGHWGQLLPSTSPTALPIAPLTSGEFFRHIESGYQINEALHQGRLPLPNGDAIRWLYRIKPIWGYGHPTAKATMGIFSNLPVFEPGWQILMAHGLATGWIEWKGRRYSFENVPAYAEKNWGSSFPKKWFWMQANHFTQISQSIVNPSNSPISVVCAGGLRDVLWWQEEVGLAALHWGDRLYEFPPETSQLNWHITPWGHWNISTQTDKYRLTLTAHTNHPPTKVLVPTNQGMSPLCQDTSQGHLTLTLNQNLSTPECPDWSPILNATTTQAALELGGPILTSDWSHTSSPRAFIPTSLFPTPPNPIPEATT